MQKKMNVITLHVYIYVYIFNCISLHFTVIEIRSATILKIYLETGLDFFYKFKF